MLADAAAGIHTVGGCAHEGHHGVPYEYPVKVPHAMRPTSARPYPAMHPCVPCNPFTLSWHAPLHSSSAEPTLSMRCDTCSAVTEEARAAKRSSDSNSALAASSS